MIIAYFVDYSGDIRSCEMDSDMYVWLKSNKDYRFVCTREI